MKKCFVLLIMVFVMISSFSQTTTAPGIKGMILGTKDLNPTPVGTGCHRIDTTFAGMKGIVAIRSLKDSTIFSVFFQGSPNVGVDELGVLINSIETNYNIKFKELIPKEMYTYKSDIYDYMINCQYKVDGFMFSITDKTLKQKYDIEVKERTASKTKSDF